MMQGRKSGTAFAAGAGPRGPICALPAPRFCRAVFIALAALALAACADDEESNGQQRGEQPPPPVTVTTVAPEDVDVFEEYAGRVRASRNVEIRARVEGILEERLYVEGETVDAGEPLFRIDPEPYEIALEQAKAERAEAQANLNQAKRQWKRISSLYERDVASEHARDEALSERELAQAQLALAQAGVADARRNLGYTEVRAPIAGTTGLENLPEGSLIDAGALLTTMTQHDPVHVRFALPQDDAATQRAARRALGEDGKSYQATLVLPDGSTYPRPGEVDFTDRIIDPQTGTVSARAVFPNPDRQVVPGEFVRVRIAVQQLENVYRIDQVAVSQGSEGPQVFVVDEEDTAHARPVRLGPEVDGDQVVLEGLEDGERIVVNGQVALQDGMTVSPQIHGDDDGDRVAAAAEGNSENAGDGEENAGERIR